MIIEYCQKAIEKAEYKKLEDDTWYAELLGFKGVWFNGKSIEECRSKKLPVISGKKLISLSQKMLL